MTGPGDTDGRSEHAESVYRIVVRGRLDPSWTDRLAGMEIRPDEKGTTVLTGPVRDRAELTGVLNALSDLRLTLLSVEAIEEEERR